ncbi:MAG: hypothetical protein PHU46_11060 [Rhodocyclaceae bacterium]|nr:hypothetical protein [Rhodocyclaceae bacterium]
MSTKLGTSGRAVPRTVLIISAFIELLLLCAPDAWAVPSYSRRYGVDCHTCHSVWGALTPAGLTFKLSGYRAIAGVDLKPDSPDIQIAHATLVIPTTLPLSFVTGVGFDSRTEKRTFSGALNSTTVGTPTTSQSGSTFALEDASIFMTSPLGKNLSAFVEFPMYETRAWEFTPTGLSSIYAANYVGAPKGLKFATEKPGFEVAKFFWNNLLGDSAPRDSVNLQAGITHLPLAYSPGKVRLPVNQDLIYERRALDFLSRTPVTTLLGADAADGLFRLSEPQGMVELFGMVVPGGEVTDVKNKPWVEYHFGVSNGSNASAASNTHKDIYGRVTVRGKGQSLGFFAYRSADTYDDALRSSAMIGTPIGGSVNNANDARPLGIMSGLQVANEHSTYGPHFTLSLVPFGVPLWLDNDILVRHESNPTGFGVAFNWKGGFNQLNWGISKDTMAYARYDWIRADRFDDTHVTLNAVTGTTLVEAREKDYVLGVQSLIQPNLKFIGEYRNHKFEDLAGAGSLTDNGLTLRFMIGF